MTNLYKTQFFVPLLYFSGVPPTERPSETERLRNHTLIPSHFGLTELEDFIVQLYPHVTQLARIGFDFAKSTKNRQLSRLVVTTVSELRSTMNRGQLFIIPKRDLLPLMVIAFSISLHNCYWLICTWMQTFIKWNMTKCLCGR